MGDFIFGCITSFLSHTLLSVPVARASQNKHGCFSLRFRSDGFTEQKPFNLSFDQMNLFSFITVNDNRFLSTCLIVHGSKKCHRVTRGGRISCSIFVSLSNQFTWETF